MPVNNNFWILIVDDSKDLTLTLGEILKTEGYNVMIAHDGKSAQKICTRQVFDMGFIDIKLPDIDGVDLVDKLSKLSPVMEYILITGFASVDSAVKAVSQKQIVAYERKPLKINTLLNLLKQIMQRRQAENELKQTIDTLKKSVKEKEILLREIHHRVKNNMQVIISLLKMHSRKIKDPRLGEVFNECRDRVNAISLVHEALYLSNDFAQIDFEDYLKKLCQNLSRMYGASHKGITVEVNHCDVILSMDQSIAIGMVITELVSNAFKHAFLDGHGGKVSLCLSVSNKDEKNKKKRRNVKLIVKDNGQGMPRDIDILNQDSLGFGLHLAVATVIRELDGSIKMEQNEGTAFIIEF